jgi:hypothetical protein
VGKNAPDAKAGVIPQHLDQTQELTDALRLIGMWREQAAREGRPVAKVISEGMAQMDLLTGEIRPETQVFHSVLLHLGCLHARRRVARRWRASLPT